MFGTRAGQIEEERIPERLIEVLGIKPRFSMLAGPGHQFLAVRLFPAGVRPDAASNPSASKGKHGRPRGISYEKEDTPIVEEMHRLIEFGNGEVGDGCVETDPQDPGFRVIGTSDDSKICRVVGRYKKVYPEHNGA